MHIAIAITLMFASGTAALGLRLQLMRYRKRPGRIETASVVISFVMMVWFFAAAGWSAFQA